MAKTQSKNPKDIQRAAFYRNQVIAWVRKFKPDVDQAIRDLAEKKYPKAEGSRKRVKLEKELENPNLGSEQKK